MVEYKGDSVQADDGKEDTKNNTIEHRNDAIEEWCPWIQLKESFLHQLFKEQKAVKLP